jgi:Flp pilus assembly pilin Flp
MPSQSSFQSQCGEDNSVSFLTFVEDYRMLRKLWIDEAGAIVSAEIVLVATILVIGMVTGLASLRDAVVTELADVGQAISQLDQSFSFGGIDGHCASSAGSQFLDAADFCDPPIDDDVDITTSPSRCVVFCNDAGTGIAGETSTLP